LPPLVRLDVDLLDAVLADAHDVKEDKKEIRCNQSEEGVDLRDRGLLLQVVQSRILGKLDRKIQLADDS
jgi:hypothetical protein